MIYIQWSMDPSFSEFLIQEIVNVLVLFLLVFNLLGELVVFSLDLDLLLIWLGLLQQFDRLI